MDALDAITNRRSISRLVDPGPTPAEIATLLGAAVSAPDHGKARPWRFVVFTGEDRARFGEVLEASARHLAEVAGEPLDEARAEKERRRFLRAPVVVAVLCRMQARRVLQAEQRDAVAAAAQNLLVAATALGYGSIWRTGDAANSPVVREAFGLDAGDVIVGFIYLGTVPPDTTVDDRAVDPTPWIEPVPRWTPMDGPGG